MLFEVGLNGAKLITRPISFAKPKSTMHSKRITGKTSANSRAELEKELQQN
jgi:hypothetical protein